MIKAEIIADSLNEYGQRLTTFVLVFPRIVLAEFNTHRMFSRNSASSRAIPFEKMLKMVKENPFIPIRWMKDHKGMQGIEYFEEKDTINQLRNYWLHARDEAVNWAEGLSNIGLTKQIVNRLLEPFMWHTCICTSSEWQNFFALRAEHGAEIHIQQLAYDMLEAYNTSTPKLLKGGEWHIPFGDTIGATDEKWRELEWAISGDEKISWGPGGFEKAVEEARVQIATARCARVSYLNFEGKDDYEADIRLHNTLLKSGHMSPFEHCARAMSAKEYDVYGATTGELYNTGIPRLEFGWCGNFNGFIQYRKMIAGENKKDTRVHEKII